MLTAGPAPLIGVFTGINLDITGADDAFLEIIGYDRAAFEVSRLTLEPLSPPESEASDRAALASASAVDGFTAPHQKEFVRSDGSRVPVLVVISLVDEQLGSWIGYAVDLSWSTSGTRPTGLPLLTTPQPLDFYSRLLGELIKERTRLTSMLDGTEVMIWAIDPTYRLVGSNLAFQNAQRQRSGRTLLTGDQLLDESYARDAQTDWETWYQRALNGDRFDVRVRTDQNRIIDFAFSPVPAATGALVMGATIIGVDVTADVRANDALARREALLRIAAQLGRVTSWLLELPDAVTLSEELAEFIGEPSTGPFSLEQTMAWYPAKVEPLVRAGLTACIASGTPFDLEFDYISEAGPIWARLIGEAQLGTDGRPVAVHGAFVDITEQKALENRLREQADVLDNSTEAILVQDLDGFITYWNRAAEELYGWTALEAVGRHISELVDAGETSPFEEMTERLQRDGEWSGRVSNTDRHGRTFPIDLHVNLIRGDDGEVAKVFSIASDATERVQLEEQLSLAQRLESVGQLTGGLAHDFNNLLTVVIGGSELIAEYAEQNEELAALNDMVLSAAERGALLTNRLLAFARRQNLQPRVIDPSVVVDDLLQLLRRSFTEVFEISTLHESGLWRVLVDPGQLESALMNVALNARDAMPRGGSLTFGLSNVSEGATGPGWVSGEFVEILITDTGTGMPAEVRDRAFDPFFTTKPTGKGSGLGLSMVYGFTKQSGGHVELLSAPGAGTSVRILLPRATESATAEITDVPRATEVRGGTERILVVEDEPTVRRHAVTVLTALGYAVFEAQDGPDALAAIARLGSVDLLFTDIVMPGGMNGVELARRVAETIPGVRTLFTSGYTDTAIDGWSTPDLALINKPYRRIDLANAVRSALDQPSS